MWPPIDRRQRLSCLTVDVVRIQGEGGEGGCSPWRTRNGGRSGLGLVALVAMEVLVVVSLRPLRTRVGLEVRNRMVGRGPAASVTTRCVH